MITLKEALQGCPTEIVAAPPEGQAPITHGRSRTSLAAMLALAVVAGGGCGIEEWSLQYCSSPAGKTRRLIEPDFANFCRCEEDKFAKAQGGQDVSRIDCTKKAPAPQLKPDLAILPPPVPDGGKAISCFSCGNNIFFWSMICGEKCWFNGEGGYVQDQTCTDKIKKELDEEFLACMSPTMRAWLLGDVMMKAIESQCGGGTVGLDSNGKRICPNLLDPCVKEVLENPKIGPYADVQACANDL